MKSKTLTENCKCNYSTKPNGTDMQGAMCCDHVQQLLSSQKQALLKRVREEVIIGNPEQFRDMTPGEVRSWQRKALQKIEGEV